MQQALTDPRQSVMLLPSFWLAQRLQLADHPVGGSFVANIARNGSNITDFDRLFEIEFLASGVESFASRSADPPRIDQYGDCP
jgi:hypothetical protein